MAVNWNQLALDFYQDVAKELRRFYPQLVDRAFGDASAIVGVEIAFDLEMAQVQELLDELLTSPTLAGIGETLIADARRLIGQFAEEGMDVDEVARQLRKHGVTDSPDRAARIARTETATAYSRGALLAYAESGVVSETEWLTAEDDKVSELCQGLNGKRAKLGEPFDGDISNPPAHPNCRCVLVPIVE